jgi:putative oxidoreductase
MEEATVIDAENIAGPLLAPMFIRGGWDAFQNPESKVKAAEAVTRSVSARLSFVPDDPAVLVRLNGAVQVGAGALLATGPFRRLAALLLIGSLIPTTFAGHAFWKELDEQKKAQQQIQFLKNAAMLGGLVLIAAGRRNGTRRAN